jgi:hypothetical protein
MKRVALIYLLLPVLLTCSNEERPAVDARERPLAGVAQPNRAATAQVRFRDYLGERKLSIRWGDPSSTERWATQAGEIAGRPGSMVISSLVDGKFVGFISTSCAQCEVVEVNAAGMLSERKLDRELFTIDASPLIALPEAKDPAVPCADGAEITALLYYTKTSVLAAGNAADIETEIRAAAVAANLAFARSGLSTTFKALSIERLVDFVEDGNIEVTLQSFAQEKVVLARREELGADVVILIAHRGNACGIAFEMDPTKAATFENSAFAVVRRDCLACNWSLAHELGHLMGACHQRSRKDCPMENGEFNFGHQNQPPKKSPIAWITMMSTHDDCYGCPRLNQWSTPLKECGGDPTGTTNDDNVTLIATTAQDVARFRCTKPGV